jgi:uncharacterized protein (DUF433 family)
VLVQVGVKSAIDGFGYVTIGVDSPRLRLALIKYFVKLPHRAMNQPVVTVAPDVMSGMPVFPGTRVPVQHLWDYLKGDDSIDDFLDGFPSVQRQQVIAFLESAEAQILSLAA